ncbi:MAG: antirestriction protein [Nanoarchaeota archaeon]
MEQNNSNYKNICKNRINEATNKILEMFKTGNVPETIAILTHPKIKLPSNNWSLRNRLIMYLQGTQDARGFNMWKEAGRTIKAGSKALYILAPSIIKEESEEKEEKLKLIGFRPIPVFKAENTQGKPLNYENIPLPEFKFLEVAKSWGLRVEGIGFISSYYGAYSSSEKKILMASPEEEVFYHELSHASHDRAGLLNKRNIVQKEIVAEFCSAVLCYLVNKKTDRLGNSYKYLESYCGNKPVHAEVLNLISDIEKVLNLILEADRKLKEGKNDNKNIL